MVQYTKWRSRAVATIPRLQAWWRGAAVRHALWRLRSAALRVQRWRRRRSKWLGLLACLRWVAGEASRRRLAATSLQRVWRGAHTRRLHAKALARLRRAAACRRRAAARKAPPAEGIGGRRPGASGAASSGARGAAPAQPPSARRLGGAAAAGAQPASSRAGGMPCATGRAEAVGAGGRGSPPSATDKERGRQSPRGDGAVRDGGRSASASKKGSAASSRCPRLAATAPLSARGPPIDADVLLAGLISRSLLSCSPQATPWPQEAPGRSDIEVVRGWLVTTLPAVEVRAILRVECQLATAAYTGVRKSLGPERLLWHGTPWAAVANIVRHGFNRAYGGRHGARLGRGTYFAEDASYALRFCGRSPSRALFLAGVLPGRYCRGEDGLVEAPADDSGARYDSTVDDLERPKVFCVFRDFQALPLYLAEVV